MCALVCISDSTFIKKSCSKCMSRSCHRKCLHWTVSLHYCCICSCSMFMCLWHGLALRTRSEIQPVFLDTCVHVCFWCWPTTIWIVQDDFRVNWKPCEMDLWYIWLKIVPWSKMMQNSRKKITAFGRQAHRLSKAAWMCLLSEQPGSSRNFPRQACNFFSVWNWLSNMVFQAIAIDLSLNMVWIGHLSSEQYS